MEYIFIVEQGILAMACTSFGWWQLVVLNKVSLVLTNLTCKIWPFAHSSRNCQTGIQTRLFALRLSLKMDAKLDIFCNSCELCHHFDQATCLQPFNFFQTIPDDLQNVFRGV